jgi:hypothetical protein
MPEDLRKYARQTTTRLIIGSIALIFVVGGGLILYFYGTGAFVFGLLCLLGGLVPVILILLIFWGLEAIVKRNRSE